MENIFIILSAIVFGVVLTIFMTYFRNSGQSEVEKWAEKENLKILSSEFRWVKRGPYFVNSSNNQRIFYVTLEDNAGNTLKAWVKVGGFFFGLFSESIEITWEK